MPTKRPHTAIPAAPAYRYDLQSLRALAITLVLAAHAHVGGLAGGFIGVDVFFVLSGYLISGLILAEVETQRRFDALMFYAKRLKRLLPALMVVLLGTAILGWILVSPLRQASDAEAGQAAAIWLSNFYFSARVIDYFSAGLNSNLFLHTWSLSVEEQFYLVWPWMLLFLYGVWRWQGAPFSRRRLAISLGFVATLSLALSVYWSIKSPEAGFYLMPGRVWEFALGALVLLLRQWVGARGGGFLYRLQGRSVLNVIGIALILTAAIFYTDSMRYPGFLALLPTLGAALILLDMPEKTPKSVLSKILLKQPVVQFFGNISYSLYLWHWPVLIIGGAIFGQSLGANTGLVLLSILLATLTYYCVERPIRTIEIKNALMALIPAALGMTLLFFAMNFWQNQVTFLLNSPAQMAIQAKAGDVPAIYNVPNCDTWYHSSEVQACHFGPENAAHTLVLFGDSVLAQWAPAFARIYLSQPDWRMIVFTKSACSASTVSYYYPRIKSPYTVCDAWRKKALEDIAAIHPDVVVMGSTHYGFTPAEWIGGTQKTLDTLSPSAGSVIMMSATPELGFNGLSCLAAQVNWPSWLPELKHCRAPLAPETQNSVVNLLKQAAKPYANVQVFDFRQAICPNETCHAKLGDHIVYRDGQHLTASFIESLAPALLKQLNDAQIPH